MTKKIKFPVEMDEDVLKYLRKKKKKDYKFSIAQYIREAVRARMENE